MAAAQAFDNYDFEIFESYTDSYGNTAPDYDDDDYEQADEKTVVKPYKYEKYASKKAEVKRNNGRIALIAVIVTMACAVICADLSGWAKGYELDREINVIEQQIVAAEGERVRLNTELDAKTNIAKIEEYAENELGMVLVENYQVEYIDLSQGDKIINSAEE